VTYTLDNLPKGKSDWARVNALTDEDIERAIASDPDAAPIATEEWFRKAQIWTPTGKCAISLRVDNDVLNWFRNKGERYQTRMNAVLRAYMLAHRKPTVRSRASRKRNGR